MKTLVEDLYRNIVPINEGYDFLFRDEVFVPVYETTLLVTKRTIMPINLVEEKILQLLDIGVFQIDEFSKILGLNRRLLEVTLADLYSKDLITVTSNSCRIMKAGQEALNNLNRTEKKQDLLKKVCIDGVLGKIIDQSEYQLQSNVSYDDNKLKPIIPIAEIKYYIERFKEISQIFQEENRLYFNEGTQPIKEELLKIDKVENTFVKFIRITINVFVSSNGTDIDIVAVKPKMKELLLEYKDYIINQINNKKVLRNHFKNRGLIDHIYVGKKYSENSTLTEKIKTIHYERDKKSLDFGAVEEYLLSNRKLFDGEYKEILKYLSKTEERIELYVEDLEYWAYSPSFLSMLSDYLGGTKLSIYYKLSKNEKKAVEKIRWNYKNLEKCIQTENDNYICWKTSNYSLYGLPSIRSVINDNTKCVVETFFLKNEKNIF